MNIRTKIKAMLIIIVTKPKSLIKGFIFLVKYGVVGFKNNLRERARETLKEEEEEKLGIKLSILMPVYNVEIIWLEKAIQSIREQTYKNWEICIVDDCSTDSRIKEYLKQLQDPNIKVAFLEENQGISFATNTAAALASGDYVLLMDNDDVLKKEALALFEEAIMRSGADILYSDQDIIDENDQLKDPLLKPDYSPDLLLSQMYIGHLLGFKKALFFQVGGCRSEYNGSQDYDLMLRMCLESDHVEHIPHILYSWRALPSSTAENPESKPYAQTAGLRAIQHYLDKKYGEGVAKACETQHLFVYDVAYPIPTEKKVSIIIPTKDHVDLLKPAIDSIFLRTTYVNYEIIILNNNSEQKETFDYFDYLLATYPNIRIENAFYEFNWSKLNNHGIRIASGDVFVFLNNDIEIISSNWLELLVSHAFRDEIGVVGPLLLYEDDTIQHAGIVVGLGGWAEHVYKGVKAVHHGSPFISPMVTRNVTAVTGACMAISKATIEKIGNFDERFIICGSDVEICIRAIQQGYLNLYTPMVRLYHYESKSRSAHIPKVDFKISYAMYTTYREKGDPYYNNQLSKESFIPKINETLAQQYAATLPVEIPITKVLPKIDTTIAEITPYTFRISKTKRKRLNLLVPSINTEHVFGGISTALKFFERLVEDMGVDCRLILTDAIPTPEALHNFSAYHLIDCVEDADVSKQVISYSNRVGKSIPVSEHDFFVFTGWWTAHCAQEAYEKFEESDGVSPNVFLYFIQDYEPGFYSWSSRYLLADATYKSKYPQIAVFNSFLLQAFFKQGGYKFYKMFSFDPVLNDELRKQLMKIGSRIHKKKQILVYGRPSTERNAFSLVVASLKKWVELQEDIDEWTILSAGELHETIALGKDKYLESIGKMSLADYAKTMEDTYAGISLMVSPHPSYPPLEMSVFGVKVITNTYANKNLHMFNKNLISLDSASPSNIANTLHTICRDFKKEETFAILNEAYCSKSDPFNFINELKTIYNEA